VDQFGLISKLYPNEHIRQERLASGKEIVFPDLLTRVTFDMTKILPEYAVILFNSDFGRSYFGQVPQGASPSMVKVSQPYMAQFQVPFLGNIDKQRDIISSAHASRDALLAIVKIREDAENQINRIIESIWG